MEGISALGIGLLYSLEDQTNLILNNFMLNGTYEEKIVDLILTRKDFDLFIQRLIANISILLHEYGISAVELTKKITKFQLFDLKYIPSMFNRLNDVFGCFTLFSTLIGKDIILSKSLNFADPSNLKKLLVDQSLQ